MRKKPNIVLITIDSLRADFLGYQNPKEKNTPFLDSFAGKSYSFVNGISPANPTFFTYCSLMTGTLPFAFGNYLGVPDNKEIKTIAEVMRNNGYSTYAFLADSPSLYSEYGYDKGFDLYDDGYENTPDKFWHSFGEILWKIRQALPEIILAIFEPIRSIIVNSFTIKKHLVSGKKLNKKAKDYLTKKGKDPFFLWLHYMDTHLPYANGLSSSFFKNENFIERFLKKLIFYKELSTSIRRMKLRNDSIAEIYKEVYRTSIKYLDQCLKEMIVFLQNQYSNTIFIIASDHGEAFMEHGMFGHEAFSLYNELIHVPILIHVPSAKPRRVTETVSLISLAKTIAELVNIKVPQFQGNNLITDAVFSPINNISRILYKCRSPHVRLGILDNKTEIHGYTELWSFSTASQKYIKEKNGQNEEYYDLLKDRVEKNNLIKDKASISKQIINQLEEAMREAEK